MCLYFDFISINTVHTILTVSVACNTITHYSYLIRQYSCHQKITLFQVDGEPVTFYKSKLNRSMMKKTIKYEIKTDMAWFFSQYIF